MNRTALWWLVALGLALAALLALRGCGHAAPENTPATASPLPARPAASAIAPGATAAAAAPRDAGAFREALAMLRAYVALLPADIAQADRYWANGTPAAGAREADLRALPAPPDRIKLGSRAAEAFLAAATADAVRVPVELQLGYRGQPSRRYAGWYEVRADADGRWVITGAAVDAVPAGQ